jgi:hypothetical protein
MSFFDLNDDVKSIIAKHLTNDYKISTMLMSKHYDLQKSLCMCVCVCVRARCVCTYIHIYIYI